MPNRETTLLQGGVTNALADSALSTYLALDPGTVHQYFNDFDVYTAGDWTVTNANNFTNSITAGNGGILWLEGAATSAALDQLTLKAATFVLAAPNAAWFKARLTLSDATNAQVLIGLQELNTSAFGGSVGGIWFQKLAGGTTGNFVVSSNSAGATTTSGQSVSLSPANTYVDVGWYYNGGGGINTELLLYANNGNIGQMSLTNVPTNALALTIAALNGSAAGQSVYIDYVLAAVQRDSPSQFMGV